LDQNVHDKIYSYGHQDEFYENHTYLIVLQTMQIYYDDNIVATLSIIISFDLIFLFLLIRDPRLLPSNAILTKILSKCTFNIE
jgi:hypothetical protein